jgi:hypothetical protein
MVEGTKALIEGEKHSSALLDENIGAEEKTHSHSCNGKARGGRRLKFISKGKAISQSNESIAKQE